jgi:hypothetical protein
MAASVEFKMFDYAKKQHTSPDLIHSLKKEIAAVLTSPAFNLNLHVTSLFIGFSQVLICVCRMKMVAVPCIGRVPVGMRIWLSY